jgi:hypothetical protein
MNYGGKSGGHQSKNNKGVGTDGTNGRMHGRDSNEPNNVVKSPQFEGALGATIAVNANNSFKRRIRHQ